MPDLPAADFQGVFKTYTDLWPRRIVRAVENVSFRVAAGEVFGLVGPNRAGKTTLVKILLTLCRPTSGQVQRLGRPASDRRTLAQIGYMHENQAFPRYWSAAGLLQYYGALTLLPEATIKVRAPKLLEKVGLADRSQEPISRFSKGMVQRLGLAQALLNEPELLVLDEPTEGLDLKGRALVFDLVAEQRRRGRTVLLVSHLVGDLEQLCDRLAVIVNGRLVGLGPPSKIIRDADASSLEGALRQIYEKEAAP